MLAENISSFYIGNGKYLTTKLKISILFIVSIPIVYIGSVLVRHHIIYVINGGKTYVMEEILVQIISHIMLILWIGYGWCRMIALIWIICKYSESEGYYYILYTRKFFVIRQILNDREYKIKIDFKDIFEFRVGENGIYLATKLKEGQTWPNLENVDSSPKYSSNWIYRIFVSRIITNHMFDDQLVEIRFDTKSKLTMSDKILLVNSISRD